MWGIFSVGLDKTFSSFVTIVDRNKERISYEEAVYTAYNLMVNNKVNCFKHLVETFNIDLSKNNFYQFMSNRVREKCTLFAISRQPQIINDRVCSDKFFCRSGFTISKKLIEAGYKPDTKTMEGACRARSRKNVELILKSGHVNAGCVLKQLPQWDIKEEDFNGCERLIRKYFVKDLKKI